MSAWVWKFEKTSSVKKSYIWNPSTYTCENGKYLGSIIDDSVITCDEIIEEKKLKKITPTKTTSTELFQQILMKKGSL